MWRLRRPRQTSPQKPTATEVGVTATTIRIAVVADVDNSISPGDLRRLGGGRAGLGGLHQRGRGARRTGVVVDFIDSHLSPSDARNAVIQACTNDFVCLGTSAVFLNDVSDIESCVDQAGRPPGCLTSRSSPPSWPSNAPPPTYVVNPSPIICSTQNDHPQTYQANMGRAFYYESKYGKNLHGLYLLSGDLKSTEDFEPRIDERDADGRVGHQVGPRDHDLCDLHPRAPTRHSCSSSSSTTRPTPRAAARSARPCCSARRHSSKGSTNPNFIWDCTLQCYDQSLLAAGPVVNGTYVSLLFLPFEEASSNTTLANFLKYTGKDKADGFGIQAYASGLLLSQAIDQIVKTDGVNGVTRKAVFRQLSTITSFNAGGMIGTTNIAGRRVSPCYVLTKVENGKFVRVTPTKKGTFDCNPRNVSQIKLDISQ